MDPVKLPEAWCAQTTWTHRVVRLPYVPPRVRQWLPEGWCYRTCTTRAPAAMCGCGMYRLVWGQAPWKEVLDGREKDEN